MEIFIVYKSTNTINGKYYIGVHKQHSTEYDGYLGSGPAIKAAIKKYGKEHFTRETLSIFDEMEDAYNAEVTHLGEKYKLSECYNGRPGGRGTRGQIYVGNRGKKMKESNKKILSKRMKDNNPNYMPGIREKISRVKTGVPNPSKRIPIEYNGIQYESKSALYRDTGLTWEKLERRLTGDPVRNKKHGNPITFLFEGNLYESFAEIKDKYYPDCSVTTAAKYLKLRGLQRVTKLA